MTSPCPTPEVLNALLQGNLPPGQESQLQVHLEECSSCQESLERLVARQESWVHAANQLAEETADSSEPLAQVIHRLKGRNTSSETGAGLLGGREGEANPRDLGFLEPTQNPDHLGRLGHYEILSLVGKGAFGLVFKAHDEVLDRVVAIKVLAPQLSTNGTARKRFIREAKAAAAVSHDHVVGIHAVNEASNPPYIVMQFIHGISLQDRIDRTGPLQLPEILRIGIQTAAGLAAAHAQGLVHRDIKPSNILLENGIEKVKLTDFGLARAVDDASVTQTGVIAGTPMFMSPEQARGEMVDHRSDLFSLGSVLYNMCTGRLPFRANGSHAVLRRVIEEKPRSIREINQDIPEWFCAVISKLQAKNPDDRFQTAREVADLLGQHLAHIQQPDRIPCPEPILEVVPVARRKPKVDRRVVLPRAVYYLIMLLGSPLLLLAVPILIAMNLDPGAPLKLFPVLMLDLATFSLFLFLFSWCFRPRAGIRHDWHESSRRQIRHHRHSNPRIALLIGVVAGIFLVCVGLPTLLVLLWFVGSSEVIEYPRPEAMVVPQPPNPPGHPKLLADDVAWTSLFNGKNLQGWKLGPNQPGVWKVEKGILQGTCVEVPSYLFSERGDFQNFHLRAELRINESGDSGIFFRSRFAIPADGKIPDGYEAQIVNGTHFEAGKKSTDQLTGSLFNLKPFKNRLIGMNKWFVLDILAQGNHLILKVNGQTTADYIDLKNSYKKGHLVLQVQGPYTKVEFRKIEIQEFPFLPDQPALKEIVEESKRLVALNEQKVKRFQALFKAGSVPDSKLLEVESALLESQINLAQVENNHKEVTSLLADLVNNYQRKFDRAKQAHANGVIPENELNQVESQLREVRIRWLAAKETSK